MEPASTTTTTSSNSGTTSTTTSVVAATGEGGSVTSSTTARSSMIDSLRGCGLSGMRIDKEDLRRRIMIPQYLRLAMRRAINSKEVVAGVDSADLLAADDVDLPADAAPMVVFINSRSGGRHGPTLMLRLQQLMGEEQVCFYFKLIKDFNFVLIMLFFCCFCF